VFYLVDLYTRVCPCCYGLSKEIHPRSHQISTRITIPGMAISCSQESSDLSLVPELPVALGASWRYGPRSRVERTVKQCPVPQDRIPAGTNPRDIEAVRMPLLVELLFENTPKEGKTFVA
jgi:hypothetical protein